MKEINSMTFSKKDQDKGLHIKFIQSLLELNEESEDYFVEIVLKVGDTWDTLVVEWFQNWRDGDFNYKYVPISPDENVMFEYQFPDGHYQWVESFDEAKELENEWLKDNPGWELNSFGRWVNKEEEEKLRQEVFGLDEKENK